MFFAKTKNFGKFEKKSQTKQLRQVTFKPITLT